MQVCVCVLGGLKLRISALVGTAVEVGIDDRAKRAGDSAGRERGRADGVAQQPDHLQVRHRDNQTRLRG